LRGDGADHVARGQSAGFKRVEIEINLDLALLAAEWKGNLGTFDGGQLDADGLRGKVVQLRFVQAGSGQP
jgi:hypothetical protein